MAEIGAGDALAALHAQKGTISRNVGVLTLKLCGNQVLDPSPETIARYALRDSISHRLNSVEYHLSLLVRAQLEAQKELEAAGTAFHDDEFLFRAGNPQLYLFDDLIFNICSLWDYVAGFIACAYRGKPNSKWNTLVKSSKDKSNTFSRRPISTKITLLHEAFVDSLFGYRALLYHNKSDASSYSVRWTYSTSETRMDFKAGMPQRLKRKMKFVRDNPDIESMNLTDVCFLIAQRTLTGIAELIEQCMAEAGNDLK